jgi:hypothetical protein
LQDKPAETDARRLQQAALEVLRDIGDENSLNIVRDARLGMDPITTGQHVTPWRENRFFADSPRCSGKISAS